MNTLRLLPAEKRYESLFNVRTASIKASKDPEHFHYQGASYSVLLELFKKLPADVRNSGFVDYGCGKGRALFCAEYSGFDHLIGVELDKDLIKEAEKNLITYSQKRQKSHFTLVHQNAVDFKIPDNCRVFYFFNPFSDKIMERVAQNIVNYRQTLNVPIYVLYVNPKYDALWTSKGFKKFYMQKNFRYTEAIIYTY